MLIGLHVKNLPRVRLDSCLRAGDGLRKRRAFPGRSILSSASADPFRMAVSHSRRTYDYRIQEAIFETGDRDLFPQLNIPRSTIRSWIHRGTHDGISCDLCAYDHAERTAEIERLRRRTALLGAVVQLNRCPDHAIGVADSAFQRQTADARSLDRQLDPPRVLGTQT